MNVGDTLQRWRAADDLLWARFEDSSHWVVFNPASAEIHLLTEAARRLWQLVPDAPNQSVEALTRALDISGAELSEAEVLEFTRDTLEYMDRAGILIRA